MAPNTLGGNVRIGRGLIEQFDDAIRFVHLIINAGEVQDVLEISRIGARLVLHVLQLVSN